MQILIIGAPKLTDDEFAGAYYFLHDFMNAFECQYLPQVKKWHKKYRTEHPFESQLDEYENQFRSKSDQNLCESNDDEPF
jgi:hypothetical protein